MKKIFLTLSLLGILFGAHSQNVVYDSSGKKRSFIKEDLDIEFYSTPVTFPSQEGAELAPAVLAMIPTLVDVGFKLTGSALEKRTKKFSAEYIKQKSNLAAGNRTVPNFSLKRVVTLDGSTLEEEAFIINFKAEKVEGINGFVYIIDTIQLNYSSAKATSKKNSMDYTVEIKPTFLIDGKKQTQELSPLVIPSVGFGILSISDKKHRTDIIPIPVGGVLTEISIKIIETNPAKIRAEKNLSAWNDNKDNIKTVINNFLPKEEETKDPEENSGSTAAKSEASSSSQIRK